MSSKLGHLSNPGLDLNSPTPHQSPSALHPASPLELDQLLTGDAEVKVLFHRELGLSLRSWVIWYYTFGVHCTRKFARSHAHLFYFVRDPKRFTFNDGEIRVPSAR